MALISIPTSIGGVSIPGGLINGPLGALFGNIFGSQFLQYPRDLSSATRGHVVQFSVNEIQPIGYEEGKTYGLPTTIAEGANFVENLFNGSSKVNLALKPKKKRSVATISLYMPDTMNFQQNSGYSNLTLLGIAEDIAKGVAGATSKIPILGTIAQAPSLGISATQSNAAKLALSTQGLAINPQQQLLFDGIDFRDYQMAFTFTPYSREEAETVKNIIKIFRKNAAPQIVTGGAGMFFVPPSTFDVNFLFNGAQNTNINRVAESVITSIDVNYAPNGWAAMENGAPVQTTLTMNFKEIELIDSAKIQNGY
jgi:hypothetical protein